MDTTKIVIQLLGGLGLFIFGMKMMGDGLENAAGEGLKKILEKVTKNPLMSVVVGAIVTMVIQSSSATTVMVVGFVNAGLLNLKQAAGIIMGANIGTTVTTQMVALKLDKIAPVFVFIGAMILMMAKNKKRKDIASIILGFGILFTGIGTMGEAIKPLKELEAFNQVLTTMGGHWFLGLLAGAIITAILQSSSTTTTLVVVLASAGALNIHQALPIIFGCNIGTCITAMLSTIGTNKTAHKAALIHLLFNVLGTVIFIPLLVTNIFGDLVVKLSPGNVEAQIANAHTIFNIANTIVLLPASGLLIKVVNKLVKGDDEIETIGPKYLDERLLETPVIAAGQVAKETIRMANKAKKNLEISIQAFKSSNEKLANQVYENEKLINILSEEITTYLVKLSKLELSDREKGIVAATFHIVNDIERIGDHAENIADLSLQKINKKLTYSDEAIEQLDQMYSNTLSALDIAIQSYVNRDIEKAESVNAIEENIDRLQKKYRELHVKRLYDGKCNAYAGTIFLDILSNLERIGDHATNIAESIVENR